MDNDVLPELSPTPSPVFVQASSILCDQSQEKFEQKSVDDVVSFLKRNSIPDLYCEKFRENYIDGAEFVTLNDEDVKTMIPPIGLAKKILRLIKEVSPTSSKLPQVSSTPLASDGAPPTNTPNSLVVSPPSSINDAASTSASSICGTPYRSTTQCEILIPDHWRPEIESCIKEKKFSTAARLEVVRILVSQMFCKSSKPTRLECEDLARKFILKYPFAKDDLGNGYQSWSDKMVERVRNVIKTDRKKNHELHYEDGELEQPKRRCTKGSELLRRYPINSDSAASLLDGESMKQHEHAIATELAKSKPRETVLLPLMKATYQSRRMFVMNEAVSVSSILEKYPAFSYCTVIQQELGLVIGESDIKERFISRWVKDYVPAIITYSENCNKKGISAIVSDLDKTDDRSKQLTALKILTKCLCRDKKESLCYIYEEYSSSTSVQLACKQAPKRNQPRIGSFVGEEDTQYFIICEQKPLCKVASLQSAIFTMFATYYCFNLEYPNTVKLVLSFFQDYILNIPDSNKKPASYLAVVSDIKRCI